MMVFSNSSFDKICARAITHRQSCKNNQNQKGVVLFFALIALVVMSLAAVALIRSVDTNSLIAGNLSFKQSSMLSADRGVENAITWLKTKNANSLNTDLAVNGYYATADVAPHLDAKALVDASGLADMTDTQGNTITYVIQRMCTQQGINTNTYDKRLTNCLFSPGPDPNPKESGVQKVKSLPTKQIVYRITVKVVGPKSTTSYIQTFAF
jgi:type IV pilus assembly protein PilX